MPSHRKKQKNNRSRKPRVQRTVVTRNPTRNYMPSRFRTSLRFNKVATINNVGFTYANIRFTPTNAYDVDPTLGSTSMPGFSELATIYRKYRVIGFSTILHLANQESFPLAVYAGPVNLDPGSNTASYNNYIPNRAMKKVMLGIKGGKDIGTIRDRVTLANFGGSSNLQIEDAYSSNSSGGPSDNCYYMIGCYTPANLVSGLYYTLDVDIDIEMFELANPSA